MLIYKQLLGNFFQLYLISCVSDEQDLAKYLFLFYYFLVLINFRNLLVVS